MKTFRLPLLIATSAAAIGAGALWLNAADKAAKPAAAPAAAFQPGEGPLADKVAKKLKLTDDQKAQLKAIHEKTRESVRAIRDDASLDQAQKREKTHAAVRAGREAGQQVLTPEQREKAAKVRKHVAEKIRHGAQARLHGRVAGWHARQAGPGWGPQTPGMWRPERRFGPPMGMGFGPREAMRPGMPGRGQMGGPGPMGAGQWGQGRMMERGFAPGPRPGAGNGPDFGAGLQLSEEQRAKAAELRKKQQEKVAEVMKAGRDEFRALLSPEQQKKFDAHAPKPPAGK